ncbi:MAG: dihydrofolate reductase [Flavobacteriaceae bacterium]|nr:dihydrofolate reductase [Flavobacteriaceae bacterium]
MVSSCNENKTSQETEETSISETQATDFEYKVDQFADIQVLRYKVPGFDNLSLKEQELVYYLTQAGLAGRDIMWDQNYRHNLTIRKALENVYQNYEGDKNSAEWDHFVTYLKRVWFSNGIHHHYSNDKLKPEFSKEYLNSLLTATNTKLEGEAFEVIFNDKDAKKVARTKDADNLLASAINFYDPDITDAELEAFYKNYPHTNPDEPVEAGLNSKLVRENGKLVEKIWKKDGMYDAAISQIIFWLEKAKAVAENDQQAKALELLIEYYTTGDLNTWDEYAIAWVNSTQGNIDWINGFIEVYNDPKGYRGSYESIVQIKDFDMSKQMSVLSEHAQWFEDNSPIIDEHKKTSVVGISYNTVNVAGEAGDASPSTPIGVNLPNNNWIRQKHGSKSVSLGNIIDAYNNAGGSGRLKEFAYDEAEVERAEKYGTLASKLHTSLHEVIGHASGQINPGIGQPKETLKQYASTMEEARADLVALYYLMDPKLQELGVTENWEETGKAAYDNYIRNGLVTQLIRINLGDEVEQDHMMNRKYVSTLAYEKGKADNVIERIEENGKTYYKIRDYLKLRNIFGELLEEMQRIKSEGDFAAAEHIVTTYGKKIEYDLHQQILDRNSQFTDAPYSGFVNPVIQPVPDENGNITAFEMLQPKTFEEQMLDYASRYGNL